MKYLLIVASFVCLSHSSYSQIEGTELGLDGTFYASTNGGTFGLGVKYGMIFNENFIAGPSIRYQRSWTKNVVAGTQGGFNIFGGGGFFHARFYNALFLGAEFEMMKSPYTQFGFLTGQNNWAPTMLVGGGFSMEFNESWRLNAGLMYDVINHVNSPFRTQYFMRKANGAFIPMIYRIAFFFPLS